ncbi:hypothetical protein OESDEN_19425 [Oesophagostomum dentatum]|uniref:Uncharacterized protein n=1 Tax=Oesophagostomum dentatum TaxID=61180 RepID=A0A0B1SCD1_OESDE|nr:hypothetical protein OESDEN_19425 [Oesophagostomum dentatum]
MTKYPVIRLKNTVTNCIEADSHDLLGFGDIDLSKNVALRFPVSCLIVSILGLAASVAHAYTNLSRPRKARF